MMNEEILKKESDFFLDLWKNCYFALLANPNYADKQMYELHDLSWKHAKELSRAIHQYQEK